MRTIFLAFLSLAAAALCAPSGGPPSPAQGGIDLSGETAIAGLLADLTSIPGEILEHILRRSDDTAVDGVPFPPVPASTISTPQEPTAPAASPPPPDADCTPIVLDLWNVLVGIFDPAGMKLTDAAINLLLDDTQAAESHSGAGEPAGGSVTRRADPRMNGARYKGDTPTVGELFSHSPVRIFGRSLDGVDRAIAGAHGAVTRARAAPLAARDSGVQSVVDEIDTILLDWLIMSLDDQPCAG